MIYEDIIVSGSINISGSFTVPVFADSSSASQVEGSVYHDSTDTTLKIYSGSAFTDVATQPFTPLAPANIEYLVVAGGGGMGNSEGYAYYGGGGGGGGLLSSSFSSPTSGSSYTITVGAGGAAGGAVNVPGNDGGSSSISGTGITTVTATGGGGGGDNDDDGRDGGSGGGAGGNDTATTGGSGTSGQGNAGGDSAAGSGEGGAGGGGAGGAGTSNTTPDINGKNGGLALASTITGTSTNYAGGGGGQKGYIGSHGDYGSTGAGANTGFGGNAQSGESAGDSGVVILAYDSGSINCAGGIVGDAGNGRKYHQFNSSDTFKVGSTSDFQVVTDSLTVHYDAGDFSSRGTSTFTDLSGEGNNATISGATLGQNWYYDFDGSNDFGTFNSGVTGAPLTYEIWLNPDLVNSYQYVLMLGTAASTSGGVLSLSIHNANSTFYIYDGGAVYFWSNNSISAGTWVHACVSITGTTASRYLNGTLQGTSTLSSLSLAEASDLGYYGWNSQYYFNGQIGQVRVYNKALSAAEVLQNYNATKTNFV